MTFNFSDPNSIHATNITIKIGKIPKVVLDARNPSIGGIKVLPV